MSLESILMVIAPICLFTVGVIVLPILVKPRKQSGLPKDIYAVFKLKSFKLRIKTDGSKKLTKSINKEISFKE